MPRSHARISLRIWSNRHWTKLPAAAQWLYFTLISQPDINQAGVLSLTIKRWALLAEGVSARFVGDALDVLAARRYVVIDSETEELLVRTFIRNDEVWRQPNTLKNACTAACAVQSPALREALRLELLRLDMGVIDAFRTPERHVPVGDVVRATVKDLDGGNGPSSVTPSEGYDDGNADTKGDGPKRARAGAGVGVGVRTSSHLGNKSSSVGAHNASRGARLPENFAATPEMVTWAREHFPRVDGRAETAKFIDHWRAASGQSSRKRDWEAAWRNWIRKADEMGPPRRGNAPAPRPLPTDPGSAFAELRDRADAQGAARLAGLTLLLDPQPPSDRTDPAAWERARRIEWLDLHKPEIEAALRRKAGRNGSS